MLWIVLKLHKQVQQLEFAPSISANVALKRGDLGPDTRFVRLKKKLTLELESSEIYLNFTRICLMDPCLWFYYSFFQ